jgi:hypothetical protein
MTERASLETIRCICEEDVEQYVEWCHSADGVRAAKTIGLKTTCVNTVEYRKCTVARVFLCSCSDYLF